MIFHYDYDYYHSEGPEGSVEKGVRSLRFSTLPEGLCQC